MTRAEQAAWKAYPYDGGTKGWICKSSRPIFIQGYEQAEKDLALTWEDMVTINTLGSEVIGEHLFDNWSERQIYEEVLLRFREMKNK